MRNIAELKGHLLSDLELYLESLGVSPSVLGGPICSDFSVQVVRCKALSDSFFKKLLPTKRDRAPEVAALKKFKEVNQRTALWSGFKSESEVDSLFWDYLKSNFNRGLDYVWSADCSELHGFDLDFIRENMNVGPGASQLCDSRTLATKLFTGPISYANSDHLVTLYRSALVETGLWADAEWQRNRDYGFTKVKGGKIFFAKKNADIARTCCTEPNLNMLIQKAIGAFFEFRTQRAFKISLKTQADLNKELARRGSIDQSLGTIDLVSASDSTATRLFNDLCDDNFLKAVVNMSRCEVAVLPDGEEVELGMLSTMGNGFTFQIMTYIFACVVKSVYQIMDLPCSDPSTHFGVFGDDIIVNRKAYNFVSKMLHKLGYEVNDGKSFNTGLFRESCGGDYYDGHFVRGVYVKQLETTQHVCSVVNRLNRWSSDNGIPLCHTLSYLLKDERGLLLVPPYENDDAGIQVPFCLTAPFVNDDYTFRYRKYSPISRKMHMVEPDDPDCPNPPGWGLSFLSGHTRRADVNREIEATPLQGVDISIRDDPDANVRYKVRTERSHYWDRPSYGRRGDTARHEAWLAYMSATFS